MNCPNCGEVLNERALFCMICGTKIERKPVCKNCGEELDARAKFCMICGTPVGEISPAPTEASLSEVKSEPAPAEERANADKAELVENPAPVEECANVDKAEPVESPAPAEECANVDKAEPAESSAPAEEHANVEEPKPAEESASVDGTVVLYSAGEEEYKDRTDLVNVVIADGVTEIGDKAFKGCSSLTSIAIPDSVTSIGVYAFSGCKRLTSITIPNSVSEIGDGAFEHCAWLTSITLSDNITRIGYGEFDHCMNLSKLVIPDSVNKIEDNAFRYCSILRHLSEHVPSETGLEKLNYKKLEKEGNILKKHEYKSKGETKYRYTYTNGGMENKFTMGDVNSWDYSCWLYDNCLFINVSDTLYVHKGSSTQLRYLAEIGSNVEIYYCNGDVVAVGSKCLVKFNTNGKKVTKLEMEEDNSRFFEGVYSDGSISVGSSDPARVCIIKEDDEIETKRPPLLTEYLCDNFKRNMGVFREMLSGFRYSLDLSTNICTAESDKVKICVADGQIFSSNTDMTRTFMLRNFYTDDKSPDYIFVDPFEPPKKIVYPEFIKNRRAYLIDRDLKRGERNSRNLPDKEIRKIYNDRNCKTKPCYFLGWNTSTSDIGGLFRIMKNKTTLNDQLCVWTRENFDKGIMRFDTCETLDGVQFDTCEVLKEERFAPLFEKLSLLKKAKLFEAGNTDYENAVVTAEDISFVLDVDGDNVIFVACDRLFRDGFFSNYSYTAYYWHIDDWGFDQELSYCPYTEYDARKGKDNNFQPVVIPKYITQNSIPAPSTNNSFSNFGLNTVDDVLNAQGFTVEQTSGADLGVSFTELMIKTEENGEYFHGVTPLNEKPMTKYTLNFTRDGQTVKVHKCLKISAYTIDSRYGFIYAKDGQITRWDEWIASDKSSISYSGGWGDKEIVSLIVLGDYLLITELCWNCTRRGVENEYMWGGGYTSSHYFANPVLHVYSFNQGKEIKTISSVGVYPEYSVNNKGQYVIKVIHRDKPENPFESKKVKTTTLTLTVLDTAFDWIEKNMKTD